MEEETKIGPKCNYCGMLKNECVPACNKKEVKGRISGKCVSCNETFHQSFARYLISGNYCPECLARIAKNKKKNYSKNKKAFGLT